MEYHQHRHYSTAGWDLHHRNATAPSISNMISTSPRHASVSSTAPFGNPDWRPSWDSRAPPPATIDSERRNRNSPPSPQEGKPPRPQVQRLPSLRSILNSPPSSSRPLPRQSISVQNELHMNGPDHHPPSPHYYRDDYPFPGHYHMHPPRNDSVTAMTAGASGISTLPMHYHEKPQGPPIQFTSQGISRRVSHTPSSLPMMDDGDSSRRNSLKRRADSVRGPPRMTKCVGQKEIPGEGLCWVYEDGSYCRTVIDGERVNPQWGVTKAGRPRKRLAQACLTCREKKIKCEPAFPKCHQCAKSQRICKGGMSQFMGTENQNESEKASTGREHLSSSTAGGSPVEGGSVHSATEQAQTTETSDSPKSAKRARTFSYSSGTGYFEYPGSSNNPITPNSEIADAISREGSQFSLGWDTDPYAVDPKHTLSLLELYFEHIGSATYCMFPKKQFLEWVQNCSTKSQDDRMLLYSVLAMGSTFAIDPMLRSLGRHLAEIASHACEKKVGKFSLQLCQSRLMIGLFNWASGKAAESIAWDISGSAFRSISALGLNTEKGVSNLDEGMTYGFDRPTLEECRRRTFWSGFLMDRYNGFCGGTSCVFQLDDIFLRLPCKESDFENLDNVDPRPYFDYDSLLAEGSTPTISGAMAQLTLISAVWGEVAEKTSRAVHRTESPSYAQVYHEFQEKVTRRLNGWLACLPAPLRYSLENLDASIAGGYAGTFVSIHALYHTAAIRLNRHVRPSLLTSPAVTASIQTCRQHGHALLSMMQDLSKSSRSARFSESESKSLSAERFMFSTPFPGYAFLNAVDVISAAGPLSSLRSVISTVTVGLSCVEELADFWASGKAQLKSLRSRVKLLGDIVTGEREGLVVQPRFSTSSDSEKAWRLDRGLDPKIEKEDDIFYGSSSEESFWEGVFPKATTKDAA